MGSNFHLHERVPRPSLTPMPFRVSVKLHAERNLCDIKPVFNQDVNFNRLNLTSASI